ncbi:hypothetical protein OF83DRAFT_1174353 [Amylostereum chailletii]|nr:hypothetical protein OF83DRAFT_1174353 [Amylostereum chailletii]
MHPEAWCGFLVPSDVHAPEEACIRMAFKSSGRRALRYSPFPPMSDRDYIRELNNHLQASRPGSSLSWTLRQEGPSHAAVHVANVVVNGDIIGSGTGKTKQKAKSAASLDALRMLGVLKDQ